MIILSFLINSLLAERVSKPTNGAATRSINPECQDEQAAVACEDDCFFDQYSCLSSCSNDDRDCITNCNREYTKVRIHIFRNTRAVNLEIGIKIIFSAQIIVLVILNVTLDVPAHMNHLTATNAKIKMKMNSWIANLEFSQ